MSPNRELFSALMPVPVRAVTVPVVVMSMFLSFWLVTIRARSPWLLPVISWPPADWVKLRSAAPWM